MFRHAEEMKRLGKGLLSESNHCLKKDIEETNKLMEEIGKPVAEQEEAGLDDKAKIEIVEFLGKKLGLSDMSAKDAIASIRELLRDLYRDKSIVGKGTRMFLRRGEKTVGRLIKRGL